MPSSYLQRFGRWSKSKKEEMTKASPVSIHRSGRGGVVIDATHTADRDARLTRRLFPYLRLRLISHWVHRYRLQSF
jgi:hypothetical protein